MPANSPHWICFQIGARQHYANPRTLQKAGVLLGLVTDAWVPPGSLPSLMPKIRNSTQFQRLNQRYHPDLESAQIRSFTKSLITFEMWQSAKKLSGWSRMIARNEWFQRHALRALREMTPYLSS